MKPYKDICVDCGQEKWLVNVRQLCGQCVYKRGHEGRSKVGVENQRIKPVSQYSIESKEKRKEILQKDRETYLKVFKNKDSVCEECGIELNDQFFDENNNIVMISQYSHILSKAAFPEHRHNPENFNRLCQEHHHQWDFGCKDTMEIFEKNQKIIDRLKNLK